MRPLFLLRQLAWDLRANLLFRPLVLILFLSALAVTLPALEREWMAADPKFAAFDAWLAVEPGAAQVVLGTLAGSLMTVVSVVYSILLVALSLASMQFSTRILAGFMRDRVAQNTLGLLLGSFVYALLVLRSVHLDPPFVPGIAASGAVILAVSSLLALVWFIHHIVQSIQANFLLERIAGETEPVIDEVFPELPVECPPPPPVPARAAIVRGARSGYIQLVDTQRLLALAAEAGTEIHLLRGMGRFVPQGAPFFAISPASLSTPALEAGCVAAVDLGPVRTMQLDAEWGFRQIVDIALKALSPAVNDPSTAATCVDHLSRLLIRASGRARPPAVLESGAGRLVSPQPSLPELIDLSFEQIRQYARHDMAVTLRLLRALRDVAECTRDRVALERVQLHARLIEASAAASFAEEDRDELQRRLEAVRDAVRGSAPS